MGLAGGVGSQPVRKPAPSWTVAVPSMDRGPKGSVLQIRTPSGPRGQRDLTGDHGGGSGGEALAPQVSPECAHPWRLRASLFAFTIPVGDQTGFREVKSPRARPSCTGPGA